MPFCKASEPHSIVLYCRQAYNGRTFRSLARCVSVSANSAMYCDEHALTKQTNTTDNGYSQSAGQLVRQKIQ
jgi:hypothetical protein